MEIVIFLVKQFSKCPCWCCYQSDILRILVYQNLGHLLFQHCLWYNQMISGMYFFMSGITAFTLFHAFLFEVVTIGLDVMFC